MSYAPTGPLLSQFPHRGPPARSTASGRAVAALLTVILYALFALLAWRAFLVAPTKPAKAEIIATLLPVPLAKRAGEPPPVLAPMIRPRAQSPALPVITIAPPAPSPTPALNSALQGGTNGSGAAAGASGNGAGGNGAGSAGCLDPVWMKAVTDRVRQVFYYPGAALALRTTGVVTMRFIVRRDGQIDRLEIGKSSGDVELDKAAYDIMRKAQPLPPIPDRMHADRIEGELPINFGVRGFTASPTIGHC